MLRRGVQVAGLPVLISGEHRYIVQAVAVVPEAVIGGQVAVGGDDGVFQTGAFSDELIQELAVELLPQARLVPVVAVVLIKGGLEDIFGGLAEVEIGTARRRRRGGPQHNPVQTGHVEHVSVLESPLLLLHGKFLLIFISPASGRGLSRVA